MSAGLGAFYSKLVARQRMVGLDRFLPEMVKLLLTNGADVNAKNKDAETPLHRATSCGNDRIAGLLRQHGGRQ